MYNREANTVMAVNVHIKILLKVTAPPPLTGPVLTDFQTGEQVNRRIWKTIQATQTFFIDNPTPHERQRYQSMKKTTTTTTSDNDINWTRQLGNVERAWQQCAKELQSKSSLRAAHVHFQELLISLFFLLFRKTTFQTPYKEANSTEATNQTATKNGENQKKGGGRAGAREAPREKIGE